ERDVPFPHRSRHGDAVYLLGPLLATFRRSGRAPALTWEQRSSADVPPLHRKYRACEPDGGEEEEQGEVAAVDAGEKRGAEQLERRKILHPGRKLVDRAQLGVEVAREGEGAQQADRRPWIPRGEQRSCGGEDKREWNQHQRRRDDAPRVQI